MSVAIYLPRPQQPTVKGWETYYNVVKYSMPFSEDQQKKTHRQADVKEALRHSLLGISAGFPIRTWRCIQKGNAIRSRIDTMRRTIWAGFLTLRQSDVIMASTYTTSFKLAKSCTGMLARKDKIVR